MAINQINIPPIMKVVNFIIEPNKKVAPPASEKTIGLTNNMVSKPILDVPIKTVK